MFSLLDRLGELLARLSGWLFFAVGLMITWEVVARYALNAPTIWAEEMSRFLQIWATYLAMAALLRRDEFIRITLLTVRLGEQPRRLLEIFALLVVLVFALTASWYGFVIVQESVTVGRATSTMLAVPRWTTESAIPVGFGLLSLQCLVQLSRCWRNAA